MRAGRGGTRGAGQATPAPKGTGVGTLSSMRRKGGTGATCPHAHPFRANGADVGKGGAGGWRAHANVVVQTRGNGPHTPYLRAKGWRRSMRGTEWGKGKRWTREAGGEGVYWCQNWLWTLWRKQVVPATSVIGSLLFLPPSPTHLRTQDCRHSPPSPASRAAVRAQKAVHYDKGRTGHSPVSGPPRSHGPAAPRPLPSQHLPHSCGKGAHEGTSPRSLPADARRTAYPPQSPLAQASPAQPHTSRLALPCPHTQEEGRCAHPSARATPAQPHAPRPARVHKRTDGASSPALSTHARGGTARTAQPSSARATPAQPHAPRLHSREEGRCAHPSARATPVQPPAAHAHKGEGRCVNPLRTGYTSLAFTHPATPAHERMDRHIGVRVRKGESDGEGIVSEAKRSRGEAARANGGHPAPVDRLRKIHVK
ncbi:hypothetical protein EDB86DRAFT_3242902 [Lactarius hatsudake]|nr:hypothetical protein EDB86DRAFT_3242902 [Lactarius hatsudake]